MSYAKITFQDKNPIKRWLQRQRLVSAINLTSRAVMSTPEAICDFGAGNGELCKFLSERYKSAKIICYEPTPDLLREARENLENIPKIEFCENISNIEVGMLDAVYCLEVFEHLPPVETIKALESIRDLLKPGGIAIIGVPIEIGFPALYKGIFRMSRRYGAFDANVRNVFSSFFRHPPKNHPISEISPGFSFHYEHMGFDFRLLKNNINDYFGIKKIYASPFRFLGSWIMPEIYFIAQKSNISSQPTAYGVG